MKNFQKKLSKKILIGVFFIAVTVGGGIGWYSHTSAIPLVGGISTIIRWCNDGAIQIQVIGPRPGMFKVSFTTTMIYSYGQFMGTWVLGDSLPGGVCCTGKVCTPVLGTVRLIGTSML